MEFVFLVSFSEKQTIPSSRPSIEIILCRTHHPFGGGVGWSSPLPHCPRSAFISSSTSLHSTGTASSSVHLFSHSCSEAVGHLNHHPAMPLPPIHTGNKRGKSNSPWDNFSIMKNSSHQSFYCCCTRELLFSVAVVLLRPTRIPSPADTLA